MQIVTFAQKLVVNFSANRYDLSNPNGRDGVEPNTCKFSTKDEQTSNILKLIKNTERNGFEKIAIVVKNPKEAIDLYNQLFEVIPTL